MKMKQFLEYMQAFCAVVLLSAGKVVKLKCKKMRICGSCRFVQENADPQIRGLGLGLRLGLGLGLRLGLVKL